MDSGGHATHSLTEPPPDLMTGEEEQQGGGRRLPSPLPEQTPTRLRPRIKATTERLVHNAGTRRGRLLEEVNAAPGVDSQPVSASPTAQQGPSNAVQCASSLFAEVPSQSPFLTCRVEKKAMSMTLDKSSSNTEPIIPMGKDTTISSEANSIGSTNAPALGLGHQPASAQAHRASAQPENPFQVLSPRCPVPPPLLDLKETLALTRKQPGPEAVRLTGRGDPPPTEVDPVGTEDNEETPQPQKRVGVSWSMASFVDDNIGGSYLDFDDRPETPTPPSRMGDQSDLFLGDEPELTEVGACLGRTPARVSSILDEEFKDIYVKFSQISARVGLPFQQVLNRFTKQFTRTCSSNWWNIYQRFHAANKDQELARLAKRESIEATPVQTMTRCYKIFQATYPETWQKILETFEMAEGQVDGGKTVAQRHSLFLRLVKNHTQAFAGMAKAHGFEIVMMAAGSVINQDASLGLVYATPGATDFFQVRCRADDNEMLGHFKAHVYNNFSLANPAVVLDASGEGSSKPTKEGDADDEPEVVEVTEMEDHARLRSAFVSALMKLGCQWASGKLFPWKALPGRLANSGVVCHNFPDTVPFPGEDRPRSKAGSKGISDLSLAECSLLLGALGNPSKDGMFFERKPKLVGELRSLRLPVINGAPPDHDSTHKCGKRMFADGSWDRKGLPRRLNLAATRIKRKKKVAGTNPVVIDSDEDGPQIKKSKARPPTVISISDSDNTHEKPTPTLPKRTLPRRNHKGGQTQATSRMLIEELEPDVQDGVSSASGLEFSPDKVKKGEKKDPSEDDRGQSTSEGDTDSELEPARLTNKRKHGGSVSSRPAKKRAVVEVPRAAPIPSKDKGKAPVRSKQKPRKVPSPSSSEDEQPAQDGASAPGLAPAATLFKSSLSAAPSPPVPQQVPVPQERPAALTTKPVVQQHVARVAPTVETRPKPRIVPKKVAGPSVDPDGEQNEQLGSSAAVVAPHWQSDTLPVHRLGDASSVDSHETDNKANNASSAASMQIVEKPTPVPPNPEAAPTSAIEQRLPVHAPPNTVALPTTTTNAGALLESGPAGPVQPPQENAISVVAVAPPNLQPHNPVHHTSGGHTVHHPDSGTNAYTQGWLPPHAQDPRLQALANALLGAYTGWGPLAPPPVPSADLPHGPRNAGNPLEIAAQFLRGTGMPFPFPNGMPTGNASGSGNAGRSGQENGLGSGEK